MIRFGTKSGRSPRQFVAVEHGAAAVEFAFALFLLTIPILNVVDLAFYAFGWMQTQNAAQMGAQAAFSNCNNANDLPAATTCFQSNSANNMTLFDVVNQGIQESALNNTVSLSGSSVVDGYYCSTSGNVLTLVGTAGSAYADGGAVGSTANTSDVAPSTGGVTTCSGYQDANAAPGEYVSVTVTHTFTPIFSSVSVASLLPSVMTATAYVRID